MTKEKVLVVDDEVGMRQLLEKLLEDNGYGVASAVDGVDALDKIKENRPALALVDFKMPRMNGLRLLEKIKKSYPEVVVVMMTAYGTVENAVSAMKLGAFDYINKPFENEEILLVMNKALEKKRLEEENIILRRQLEKSYTLSDIVSANDKMQKVFDIARKVAQTKSTVLVQGETGTGKELVARAIHDLSPRREKAFVPVDCAALSESLLESELFGHIKGAFTGAVQDKEGLFELAHGGTVFLDEIGHISSEIQAKLLRVLQDGEIKRVGETSSRKVDIRLIAASNEDLEKAVKEHRFREDLYYRLNVVPIFIPPLRERNEDIPLLIEHFIKKYNLLEKKNLKSVSADALKVLMNYAWPGNIRELENLIHRAVVMEEGEDIKLSDLPAALRRPDTAEMRTLYGRSADFRKAKQNAVAAFEKRFFTEALLRNQGNMSRVAKEIGLDRRNLHRKLRVLKLNPRDFQS